MRWLSELEQLKGRRATSEAPRVRPFVTAAFAISRDGYLSEARGQGTAISGPESLQVTHQLRATHDALLVGVGTVLSDDPLLTTRLVAGPSPLRVVLDSTLRMPESARMLQSATPAPWLVTTARASSHRVDALVAAGADVHRVDDSDEGVSLVALLALLAEHGVRSVMVEGGACLLDSFFRAGCVDYVALTVSPVALGNPDAVALGSATRAALARWQESHRDSLGNDHLLAGGLPRQAEVAS
jgi:riboflavin-specific deaminase-like protein